MSGILLDSVLFEATVLNSLFWFVLYLICDDRFDYCRIDKEGDIIKIRQVRLGVLNGVEQGYADPGAVDMGVVYRIWYPQRLRLCEFPGVL